MARILAGVPCGSCHQGRSRGCVHPLPDVAVRMLSSDWFHFMTQDNLVPVTADSCPFCQLPDERVVLESEITLAFLDAYPVTEGRALVVPR